MGRERKGNSTVSNPQRNDDDIDGESSESPPTRTQKRKRTTKEKGKQPAKDKQPAKKKLTAPQRASAMRKMKFVPTKWADFDFLDEIGIREDVTEIFQGMGLEGILNMAQPSYKEETIQFISTLRFEDDTSKAMTDQNRGMLHFKIRGNSYSIPVAQLAAIYNLPSGGTISRVLLDWDECQAVWGDIAKGVFKKGHSKSSTIRHPALRYAHMVLAHTLFGRKEKGHMKEEEFGLLIEGIKGSLVTTTNGDEIIGQEESINYSHFLVRRFLEFQEGVDGCKDAKPAIHYGGLITPILTTLGVRVSSRDEPPIMRIGARELMTNHSLAGIVGHQYAYRFTSGATKKLLLLPSRPAMRISSRNNILFNPQLTYIYDPAVHGPIRGLQAPSSDGSHPTQQQEEDEDPVSGSSRYKFEPYDGIVSGEALRSAHKNINMLNRFVRWQNKNIKKFARTIKKQGEEIKRLKSMCFTLQRSSSLGDSTHLPWLASTSREEESSDGLAHAPISPTSSGSGNPSYSLGSSSEED